MISALDFEVSAFTSMYYNGSDSKFTFCLFICRIVVCYCDKFFSGRLGSTTNGDCVRHIHYSSLLRIMGSVCCVAAKDRNVPSGAIDNSVCSPSWSFRRDNRRRVADEIKDSSNHNVGSRGIDIDKLSLGLERGPPSSETGGLATLGSQKSADSEMGTASMVTAPLAGTSLAIRSPSGMFVQTLFLWGKCRTFSFIVWEYTVESILVPSWMFFSSLLNPVKGVTTFIW